MDTNTYIGLIALVLSTIGAWFVLRAIGRGVARGARAAKIGAANATSSVIGQIRSALRAAARVLDHHRHGHERLQGEVIGMQMQMIAELRAELAELKSAVAPAISHSPEVIDLTNSRRYCS